MRTIKIAYAIMLLGCLFDFPYGYYQLVRSIGMILFGFLAFENFQKGNSTVGVVYLVLAVLFQPIAKISLGRTLWNILDVIIGIGLLVDASTNTTDTTDTTDKE